MSLIEGLLIFFTIIATYLAIVVVLHKKGIFKKLNISFMGPALMWRTKRGIDFLNRIAKKKRFWKAFGSTSIFVCFATMILMTTLLIWQAWFVIGFTPEQKEALPGPEIALILPGINPILPLEFIGYIILAFIVAIIVHEFSHGILTIVSKLKVKSLGILYLIIPIGAFCEPDEESLKKAKTKSRMRIYAAGPTANFIVVLISILLFSFLFMSSVQPAADGISVISVGDGTPAEEVGLSPGMIITGINDSQITNISEFYMAMEKTRSNQSVNLSFVKAEKRFTKEIVLADKYNYTANLSHIGQGYLGVGPSEIHEGFLSVLKNPFMSFPDGFLLFYIIPLWGYFQGYNPIVTPFTDSFVITGVLGAIPSEIFWVIINALYWIFWLNFAVALFNVLPMIPLDGGFLFNDVLGSLVKRIRKGISDEHREKIVKNASLALSLTVLILILLPFLIKYI
jgi:membrane-associated protease RseP (regulator of RpoE activity)